MLHTSMPAPSPTSPLPSLRQRRALRRLLAAQQRQKCTDSHSTLTAAQQQCMEAWDTLAAARERLVRSRRWLEARGLEARALAPCG